MVTDSQALPFSLDWFQCDRSAGGEFNGLALFDIIKEGTDAGRKAGMLEDAL